MSLSAQQYLYIKKKGELPKQRLEQYDHVKILITGQEEWIEGMLTNISTTTITLDDDRQFYFSNIEGIRVYNGLVRIVGTAIWGGGVFFTSIAAVNRLGNGDRPVLRQGQIVFGAGMGLGGAIISRLSRRTYSKEKGYYFEVIDLEKNFEEEATSD